MIAPASFIGQLHGLRVTAPGALGGQCTDLVDLYLAACHGLPAVRANAIDWPSQSLSGFSWLVNTPTNFPDCGDIVVWGENALAGTGAYGHVAIAVLADTYELVTFDQNWPIGNPCDFVLHSYNGVMGWFHHDG